MYGVTPGRLGCGGLQGLLKAGLRGRDSRRAWHRTLLIERGRSGRESTRSGGIFDVESKRARVADLEHQAGFAEFWTDAAKAREILREKTTLERVLNRFEALDRQISDAETLLELAEELHDADSEREAGVMLTTLDPLLKEHEVRRLLADEADEAGAVLEINSGAGGTDAADWADMLKRMYLRWADRRGFKATIVDEQPNEDAGIKSCTIEIEGDYAYGYLKGEIGVHRLVRISPFDANARRQTAFASVGAYPDIDDTIEVKIDDKDLEIQTMRSGGAGGQHVNMTDSAVRIIHHPSGIVVKCQQERSQLKNKASAMKMLRAKLYQQEVERRQALTDTANSQKKKIEWGSQIRSYVLNPYRMVKDVRTRMETGDTDRFLDGDIQGFMDAFLAARSAGTLDSGEAGGE
ncbi:peptide chain release factor 2 [Deltaproteobacteria bacterium]|nr:peptide chain release factor 2 [Deltaproteobacteria bacterium]